MKTQLFALLLAVGLASGCRRSLTAPGTISHAGNWSGTTSQGTPISFTISSSERVTAISVGYDFSGCSGARTFTDLNVAITSAPAGLLPPDLQQFSGFSFRDGAEGAANATQVAGALKSETTASGAVSFENYAGCSDTFKGATWNASKNP